MKKQIFKQALCVVLAFSMTISPMTVAAQEVQTSDQQPTKNVQEQSEDQLNTEETQEKIDTNQTAPKASVTAVSDVHISDIPNQTYTGAAITPAVTVANGEDVLALNTDYTLTYVNNTNAGTAKVIVYVEALDYSYEKAFTILPKSISDSKIASIPTASYTGKAITPAVSVTSGSSKLVNTTDYTVAYLNNIQPGKATVTITGKGNYAGTKTSEFYITPSAPTGFKISSAKKSTIILSWNKVNNATGYVIFQYNETSKSYKAIKTITDKNTTTYTQTNLASYTNYKYRILSYIQVAGAKYNGSLSSQIQGKTKLGKVSLRSAIGTNNSVKVSWNKVSKASGYVVYMSTSKNKGYKKIATTNAKTASYTKEGLNPGTTYYFKVRAYVKVNKTKQYGEYSNIKKSQTRTDIRLEGIETLILNGVKTSKTNQYTKSSNQVMTKAHYTALVEMSEEYAGGQISQAALLKKAKNQKYQKYTGTKKVSLKKSNAMKLQFSGLHTGDIISSVQSQMKGKKDFVFIRVYYSASANQTTVYVVNGGIAQ